jgi:FG-GAP-like repeat
MNNTLKLAAFLGLNFAAIAATPTMPTFYARRDYPAASDGQTIVADTNGDGIPDLVINGSGIDVMFGNGDGTFRQGPSSRTAFAGIAGFALADLNGDGILDVVVTGAPYNGFAAGIAVCLGNGDGTFQIGTYYPAGSNPYVFGPVIGDFNGDGILDVVAVGNGGVWLFTGQGGGVFNPGVMTAPLAAGPLTVVALDLNGDRKLDLVITLQGSGFVILFGNGNGTFQAPVAFPKPADTSFIAVGPLTKGGPPSIVLASVNVLYLYFGNGAGVFSGPYKVDTPANGAAVAIGDVNGDGIPDIVSAGVYIFFGIGGGKFSEPYYHPIWGSAGPIGASAMTLADLRNNRRTDIITNGSGISVLLNEGKGAFEEGIWTNVTGGAGCAVKGDFNGDGRPDLAVNNTNGSSSQGISILLGTGKATAPFKAGTSIALAGAECQVTVDVNADGKLDLLVPVNGTVNTYLGNGDGTFTLKSTTPTPSGGYLVLGDFNHDGKVDFATSGNLMALGNGDGTFQNPTDIMASPPDSFSGIAAGDINNDGWTDLVLTSSVFPNDANATVLLNNHQGGFTQVTTAFGPLTYDPILVDVNGDGKLDLILSQTGLLTGATIYGASVYLGNGKGEFTFSQTVGGQTLYSTLNFVADVNGDSIPDIIELFNDTLQIYLGEGSATYATPFNVGTGPSPGSILVENLHGQSKAADLPDIVIPDLSGGVTVLLNLTP